MDNSLISTIIFALHVEQPPSSLCPKHPPPTNLQEKQILYVLLCVCLCVTKIWITACLHFACQWPAQARENTFLYLRCTASPGPSGIDHSPAGHLLLEGGEPLSWRLMRILCISSTAVSTLARYWSSVLVSWFECSKGAKDKVKRIKGPSPKSWRPEGPWTCRA